MEIAHFYQIALFLMKNTLQVFVMELNLISMLLLQPSISHASKV